MGLKEFKNAKEDNTGLTKRWFRDISLDVFIWSKDESIQKIEVSFEENASKHLWAWSYGEEGKFYEIDEGDLDPRKNLSQMARDHYDGDYQKLLLMIEQHAGDLPQNILSVFRMLA